MKTISKTHAPQFCRLPITDQRRKAVPACGTDVAETFRQFAPIHVSDCRKQETNGAKQ